MKTILVEVVEFEGKKLFRTGNSYFDFLQANYDFLGGELRIFRQGKLLTKTKEIYDWGVPNFRGLVTRKWPGKKHKEANSSRNQISALRLDYFEVGDKIEIDVLEDDFDYENYLREICSMIGSFESLRGRGESVPLDELAEMINDDFDRNRESLFRPGAILHLTRP